MKDSVLIIGGGNKNEHLDFYPTPPECTHALMMFMGITGKTIWEPACGDGKMSSVIKMYGNEVIETDIARGVDFLNCDWECCDAVITNPPFSLAESFIRKAQNAPMSAMLLKAHYWNAAKRRSLFTSFPPSYVLALSWRPNFLEARGKSPTMDFIWTVWESGNCDTRFRILERPNAALISQKVEG